MRLSNLIKEKAVIVALEGKNKKEVLEEMAKNLKNAKLINHDREVLEKLLQRESLGSTALGEEIAIPHCKLKGIKNPVLLVGVAPYGVNYEAPDGKSVKIFFLLITSPEDPSLNLQILSQIAQLVKKSPGLKEKMLQAHGPTEILEIIKEQEEKI